MKNKLVKNMKQILYIVLSLFIALPNFVGGGTINGEENIKNNIIDKTVSNTIDNTTLDLTSLFDDSYKYIDTVESEDEINVATLENNEVDEIETNEDQENQIIVETESPEVIETASPEVIETIIPESELIVEIVDSEEKSMRTLNNGTVGTVDWIFDDATGTLTFGGGTFPDDYDWKLLIDPIDRSTVTSVVFEAPVIAGNTLSFMFSDMTNLTEIVNLNLLNTSNTSDMERMFKQCSSLTSVDVGAFDTSNVTGMNEMFRECGKLTTVDVSNWDTSKCTNMNAMFLRCELLQTIDVSNWDVSNVQLIQSIFYSCKSLTAVDVSNWNTSKFVYLTTMFWHCESLTELDVSNWDTSSVSNMYGVFSGCENLETLDVSNWDTSDVINMGVMFGWCKKLRTLDVSNWNTSRAQSMFQMFTSCENLQALDISSWNVGKVNEFAYMFSGVSSLTTLDVSNWNMSSATNASSMFYGCKNLESIDVSKWNTSKLRNMSHMFSGLWKVETIDVSAWDTRSATNTWAMFSNNPELTTVDVSNWNTSSIQNMSFMFSRCKKLTTLDLSKWNTSNVTEMIYMFEGCTGLSTIDLSKWNTSNVKDMRYMFYSCTGLSTIDLSTWNTSNLTDMSYMFSGCTNLSKVNVSTWNTAKVNNMSYVFYECRKLSDLDISNWNNSVADIKLMFARTDIREITLGNKFVNSISSGLTQAQNANLYTGNWENVATKEIATHAEMENYGSAGSTVSPGTYVWQRARFELSFDLNGGIGEVPETQILYSGEKAVKPADPTREGFIFKEWVEYLVEPYSAWDFDTTKMSGRNRKLYARWEPITYNAIFVDFDGREIDNVYLSFGANISKPTDPVREGYRFVGWTPAVEATMPANDVTYTATYTINQYTVTFNNHDGSEVTSDTLNFGDRITAPADPERPGYTFTGWTPTVADTMPANDVTYTATYTESSDTAYKVEYHVEQLDGTFEVKETENLTGTTGATVEAVVKEFAGYTHDVAKTENVLTGTIEADGSLVMIVFYTRNTYTVTYKDHDDTVLAEFTGKYEETYTIPAVPTRPAHQFSDWIEIQNTRTVNQRSVHGIIPSRDVVYTARYTPIEEPKPEIVKPITDDGGPFTTDECGTITDRWGNVMYKPSTCLATTYKVPNTGVK